MRKSSKKKQGAQQGEEFHYAPSTYNYDNNYSDYANNEGFRAYQDFTESGLRTDDQKISNHNKLGPHSGKGPKGYQRPDDRIHEDVCEALYRDPEIDASEIEVKVKDRVVILIGTVESRHIKRLAEQIIESISGIIDVHNELRIDTTLASRNIARP